MQIAFVAYDRMTALDLIGPMEVLTRIPGTTSELVATRPDPFIADNGLLRFLPSRHVDEVPTPDVIVVPGGTAGTRAAMRDITLLDWLVRASAGIDMGLTLTARLKGAQLAKVIQLALEYDPQPPFSTGSPRSAGRLVTGAARLALRREFRQPV